MNEKRFAGVDGCREGWFYVAFDASDGWSAGVSKTVDELLTRLPAAESILIDMPIGLLDSGGEGRGCDTAARRVLGRPRASSVFPVPVRQALQASDYEQANEINRAIAARGITRQTWGIVPKLRELDQLMRASARARRLLREAHPEVCLWALNGKQAMSHNKKTSHGRQEREQVLRRYCACVEHIVAKACTDYRRAQVATDDVLDALVLAITAKSGFGALRTLPDPVRFDAFGLPMEIVYCECQPQEPE